MTKRVLYFILITFLFGWLNVLAFPVKAVESGSKNEPSLEEYVSKMKDNGLTPQEQKDLAILLEDRSSRSNLVKEFLSNIQDTNNNQINTGLGKTELMVLTFIFVFSLLLLWVALIMLIYYLWQGIHLRATRAKNLGLDISS